MVDSKNTAMMASAASELRLPLATTLSNTCIMKNIGVNMRRFMKKLKIPTWIKEVLQVTNAPLSGERYISLMVSSLTVATCVLKYHSSLNSFLPSCLVAERVPRITGA
jgi:hypothetical protein